ncbi:MAG TPA: acetylornithine/succinylornithine family transaminase [Gammaproteobacteria bacterium]|nr:acetylornithine/succinylornithine family transaminase [Gammaproteobacteria bacterium]
MSDITRASFDHYMMPNYAPVEVIPVRGKGSRLFDQAGREYIDLAGGIAVNALGHAHPKLVEALTEQGRKLWHVSNILANEPALALAKQLTEATFADRVFFSNSGGEANEAALKLARRYARDRYSEDKDEIIAFDNAFHGRTLFTVTVGGQADYKSGFGPLPGSITHLPFNNVDVLRKAVSEKTCAVIVEPIQGEAGVLDAEPQFLQIIRTLCDEHNALMILDEVQTGVGRTGHLYAHEAYGVTPDILTTAKALGCGFPIAATLAKAEVAEALAFGTHGSTFGGNPLACAVAAVALALINTPDVLNGVKERRQWIEKGLEKIAQNSGCAVKVRGQGLLIGWVLAPDWEGRAREIMKAAQAAGVFVLVAGPNVVRIAPSLVIPKEDVEEGLKRLEQAVMELAAESDTAATG